MTTKTWRIESEAGVVLGDYEGEDEADALDAYARDAKYADYLEVRATVGGTVTVREVAACGYREARLGHLSGPCPACGETQDTHVRECERCGTDIAADDVADLVDADGHLYCDGCDSFLHWFQYNF